MELGHVVDHIEWESGQCLEVLRLAEEVVEPDGCVAAEQNVEARLGGGCYTRQMSDLYRTFVTSSIGKHLVQKKYFVQIKSLCKIR